jgi:hypothetical protein
MGKLISNSYIVSKFAKEHYFIRKYCNNIDLKRIVRSRE